MEEVSSFSKTDEEIKSYAISSQNESHRRSSEYVYLLYHAHPVATTAKRRESECNIAKSHLSISLQLNNDWVKPTTTTSTTRSSV